MKENNNINHLEAHQMSLYIDALKMDKLHKVPASILKHIDECDVCRTEAMDLYSILGNQDYDQSGAHPTLDRPAKVLNTRSLFLRIAAAAAMLALAFFFYQRSKEVVPGTDEIVREDPQEQVSPQQEDPTVSPIDEEQKKLELKEPAPVENIVKQEPQAIQRKVAPALESDLTPEDNRIVYAASFTPSEHWESMVNENVRGADFEAKAPAVNAVFKPGETIPFQWVGAPGEGLNLVLLNNKGKEIKAIVLSGTELLWKEHLDPGRYYWKVESKDDLLFVGRFEVAN